MWWTNWWPMPWFAMGFGPVFMLLGLVVCGLMIFVIMRGIGRRYGRGTARDILDERYARGEISRDEYEAKRRDLAA